MLRNDAVAPPADRPRSTGRPTPADAAVRDRRILAAALEEFLQRGYGGASLSRIVQAACISKTTLYSRYPSKEALFRAIINDQIEQLAPGSPLAADGEPVGLEQGLTNAAIHMLAFTLEGDLLGVDRLIYSESHNFPELGAAAAERTERGIQRIAAFIAACVEREGLQGIDPRGTAEAFIFMMRGWHANTILSNRKVDAAEREQWARQAVHALLGGWLAQR